MATELAGQPYRRAKFGLTEPRTVYNVRVAYDLNAATRYEDWKATGSISPPTYPAITTSDMPASKSYYDALATEETTRIVRDPATGALMLTGQLEYETSLGYYLKWYLGLGGVFMVGLVLALTGWRKRRAHARASQSAAT